MTASPTRSNAAAMRQNKLVGATGMGAGRPLRWPRRIEDADARELRGGLPPRAEEACGVGSCSQGVNS